MIQEYTISRAQNNDAQSILEVQKLAFRSEAELHNNFNIPPLTQTAESIREDFNTYEFYKLMVNNRITGALKIRLIENEMLWIGRLIVHPEFQKRGYGKALMHYIEEKYNNVAGYELFTARKSERNIRFYEGLGYQIVGEYTEPGHSDIILVKMMKKNLHH
jgi:ribosomal protein S18 acetylase RimI-like enzyme